MSINILAIIEQDRYFQIPGVNGVFPRLWFKGNFGAIPINLVARNPSKPIENSFQSCRTTPWRRLRIIQIKGNC
jgi:hypothetical protein